MFAILEQVLQMTESLAADLRHNSTQAYALIAGTTKSALKQLVIGISGIDSERESSWVLFAS